MELTLENIKEVVSEKLDAHVSEQDARYSELAAKIAKEAVNESGEETKAKLDAMSSAIDEVKELVHKPAPTSAYKDFINMALETQKEALMDRKEVENSATLAVDIDAGKPSGFVSSVLPVDSVNAQYLNAMNVRPVATESGKFTASVAVTRVARLTKAQKTQNIAVTNSEYPDLTYDVGDYAVAFDLGESDMADAAIVPAVMQDRITEGGKAIAGSFVWEATRRKSRRKSSTVPGRKWFNCGW